MAGCGRLPGVPQQVGSFALVLHSHLPWLAHHGSWPVGEEWLHQAWSTAYLPLVELLATLADEGRRDVLTLGVTPVLAAQLDDPWCLAQLSTWLGFWSVRAQELAGRPEPPLREHAAHEFAAAQHALDQLSTTWRARRLAAAASAGRRPRRRAAGRPRDAPVPAAAGRAGRPLRPGRGPGRRPGEAGPAAGGHLAAGVRLGAGPGARSGRRRRPAPARGRSDADGSGRSDLAAVAGRR